jgi:hypothetical protein
MSSAVAIPEVATNRRSGRFQLRSIDLSNSECVPVPVGAGRSILFSERLANVLMTTRRVAHGILPGMFDAKAHPYRFPGTTYGLAN